MSSIVVKIDSGQKKTCLTIFLFLAVILLCVLIRPAEVHAATTVELQPGQTYDLSKKSNFKKYGAFYVDIKKGGEYTLTGASQGTTKNTMVRIDPPKGQTALVYLDGVDLEPDDTAPGIDSNRAPVEILDSGGTVILFSKQNRFGNTLQGQGRMPAIRKDNTTTKLIFDSSEGSPGTIVAKADPDAFRTCAIGCYTQDFKRASAYSVGMRTTGNIEFNGGIIKAYGSTAWTAGLFHDDFNGGAAIGANGYGSVNGITVNGGHIIAYPGDPGAAGIGTSACVYVSFLNDLQKGIGSTAKNITINGGKIDIIYNTNAMSSPNDQESRTSFWGGAAIGGGWRSDADGITINGGEINIAQDGVGMPWTGIGGAGESNGDNITINGGKIRINSRYTGIGGGWTSDETSFDIYLGDPKAPTLLKDYFGSCKTLLITGGQIEIKVWGSVFDAAPQCLGIGGWKKDAKNDSVEITGGDISIDVPKGSPAIGTNLNGRLRRITIRGGHIEVVNHATASGECSRMAVIGAEVKSTETLSKSVLSSVGYIEFTGGTVIADADNQLVGGYAKAITWHPAPSEIIINGGNLKMKLADDMRPISSLSKSEAAPVKLQTIELAGGKDANLKAIKASFTNSDIPLKHANGTTYQYGMRDVITMDSTPHLYFWVPEDAVTGMVETSESLFTDLDAKKYYGMFKNAGGRGSHADVAFYPPIRLNLIADEEKKGSASVLFGATELASFEPPNVSWLVESYNESQQGTGAAVLSGSGALVSGSTSYVNKNGRWIYAPADSGPELFTSGLDLYAKRSEHALELSFNKNIPARTASELNGTMPADWLYDDGDTINLPSDQNFSLKGYTFTGWNTKKDGSGSDFTCSQSYSVSDFRKTADDPALVVLYAKWEPIKYGVTYSPNRSDIPFLKDNDVTVEYTYDEPAKFADGDSLQKWGSWRNQLTGWTRGSDHYAKNGAFLNFVDFDASGDPQPRTLKAEWMQEEGEVYIHVATDDRGVENLANDIVVTSENGTKYGNLFEAVPDRPGNYRKKSDKTLPNGTFTVSIGNRRLDPKAAVFTHVQNEAVYVELDSYTTTLAKGEQVTGVTLSPTDGTDSEGRPYVVAPIGTTLHIEAGAQVGHTVRGWKCSGTEPEWDPDKAAQDIKVKGKSLLTAEAAGAHYTVVYDPNGGEGEMASQEFQVGEAQKIRKSTVRKTGYDQGKTADNYYWCKSKDGTNRLLNDEEEIGADRPLTWTDGDTVTLYAMWHPKLYDITFHDPSGTCGDAKNDTQNEGGYVYDNKYSQPDKSKLNGWHDREGYELLGWKIHGDEHGKIYTAHDTFKNFCRVNDDGSLTGYQMDAVWICTGNIVLTISKDDAGMSGIEGNIRLEGGNSAAYENYFIADPVVPGRYVYQADETKPLPAGTYTVSIGGLAIPDNKGTFAYDPSRHTDLAFEFYTVRVISDDYVTATVNGSGNDAIVLKGEGADINAETVEGCSFEEWTWLGDEGEPVWEEGKGASAASQRITVNKTLELTAHAAGIVYRVTFDANDGQYPGEAASGTMEDQDMVYGEPQNLFKNNYMRKGYSFAGWNTKADGTGKLYRNKETVKDLTADASTPVVLYARWEPETYEITYIDPYRLCKTAHQTATYNETVTLLASDAPGWQPEGHTLSGWEGVAFGSFYAPGKQVTNFCTVDEDGELTGNTLYASWADKGNIRVTVTLDNEGVMVDPDDIELVSETGETTYAGCFQWDSEVPGRYMFDPSELPSAAGGTIPDGDYSVHVNNYENYGLADARASLTYNSEQAASAILQSDTVTVKAGDNVASVNVKDPATGKSGSSVVVVNGEKASISAVVDKEGYHFGRYTVSGTKPDMDEIKPDQSITVNGPVTLTAQATPNTYLVHYDANGGEGDMADQTFAYDTAQDLNANRFTKSGYSFKGWNTHPDGSGESFANKENVKNLSSSPGGTVILYAQWARNHTPGTDCYTVKFDKNDTLATGEMEDISVRRNVEYPLPQCGFDRTGYILESWNTKPDGSGKRYEDGQVLYNEIPAGDTMTLYAQWENTSAVPVLMAWGTPSGKTAIKARWTKVDGAVKYLVYAGKCHKRLKLVKVCEGNSFTVKKIKGKTLQAHSAYKFRVAAVDENDNAIAVSETFHVITTRTMGRYANVKKITAKTDAVTMEIGDYVAVSAKYTLPKKKKHISRKHGPYLRFISDNPDVAGVDAKGIVEAKTAGHATIYIQDTCGKYCTVSITVR